MPFVIYVNHPNNKAIVHDIECHVYRLRKRDSTHNGYWSRPVPTMRAAMEEARATGKRIVDSCSKCC